MVEWWVCMRVIEGCPCEICRVGVRGSISMDLTGTQLSINTNQKEIFLIRMYASRTDVGSSIGHSPIYVLYQRSLSIT